jgi:voltage-gated potassium channel Kch
MIKPTFKDRFRYFFDNTLSKGTVALIGWLAVVMCLLIILTSIVIWVTGIATESSLVEQIWAYLVRVLGGTKELPWSFRLATLIIVLGGIFVMSSLISLLTTGFRSKLDSLRKGRSRVIENDHTVILGWSEGIFTIISELIVANENKQRSCLVILSLKDKVEMEDQIREKVVDTGRTRIICRTGNPTRLLDLDIVNLDFAKSIVIVSEEDDSSANSLKTILAIINRPNRRPEPYHIVANIYESDDLPVGRIIGKGEVELVHVSGLIARIQAQSCRQSGLSLVYTELLDFEGDEIYFQSESKAIGKTYQETVLSYENSAVIGVFSNNRVQINPHKDQIIQEGDQIIAISKDDDTVVISEQIKPPINKQVIGDLPAIPGAKPEALAILGWNSRAPIVMHDLVSYIAPNSTVKLVIPSGAKEIEFDQQFIEQKSIKIDVRKGDITKREVLEEIGLNLIDHVVLFSCKDEHSNQEADSCTFITLVHLRDIRDKANLQFTIVSEILDVANRELLQLNQADDFILSDRLVSLAMAQIAENKALGQFFEELFQPEGSEIYLKPITNYLTVDEPINFFTIVEAALVKNETAIGYRQISYANDADRNYGLVINPKKSDYVDYAETDQIIVFAEQ